MYKPNFRRLLYLGELARIHRPVGWLLLLWPTCIALWVAADGQPEAKRVVIFVLGAFLSRSVGCVINDLWDRQLDAQVERTRNRPLADGRLKPQEALVFAWVLLLACVALWLLLEPFTRAIACVAALCAAFYPVVKRIHHLPQLFLGLCFSFGIVMAFADTQQQLPSIVWLLVGANVLWVVAYDTTYALMDRHDDRQAGVKSAALLLGYQTPNMVFALNYASLMLYTVILFQLELSVWAWPGWLVCMWMPWMQHSWIQRGLTQGHSPDWLQRAFNSHALSGFLMFTVFVLGYAV